MLFYSDADCAGAPLHSRNDDGTVKYITEVRLGYDDDAQYFYARWLRGFAQVREIGEPIERPAKLYFKQQMIDGWTNELEMACAEAPPFIGGNLHTTRAVDPAIFPRGTVSWEGSGRLQTPILRNETGEAQVIAPPARGGLVLFDRDAGVQCSPAPREARKSGYEQFLITEGRCWINSTDEIIRRDLAGDWGPALSLDAGCAPAAEPLYLRDVPHHPGPVPRFSQRNLDPQLRRVQSLGVVNTFFLAGGACKAYGPMERFALGETLEEASITLAERGDAPVTSGYFESDGRGVFAAYLDAETHQRCAMFKDEQGNQRCVPEQIMLDDGLRFLDASCLRPAGLYAQGQQAHGKAVGHRAGKLYVYRVGDIVPAAALFAMTAAGTCHAAAQPAPTDVVRAYSDEQPASAAPLLPAAPAPY